MGVNQLKLIHTNKQNYNNAGILLNYITKPGNWLIILFFPTKKKKKSSY